LASASPRRRELLKGLGLSFEVVVSGVEEAAVAGTPAEKVGRWARQKVEVVAGQYPSRWILGADTIVVLGGVIYGKPQDPEDARNTLRQLAGRTHEVISGICLVNRSRGHLQLQTVRTEVRFKDLSAGEINAYVATGEPLDKAGSYGIQGMGAFLVESIHGSYSNVVGLPLTETVTWLMQQNLIAPGEPGASH
jgi:septum formation protein